MVQLNFNAQDVAPSTGFTVYPSGNYDVMINSSEKKDTKAKTAGAAERGAYLQFNLRIAAGEHAGGMLVARVNFENDNPVAEEIGQAELSAICRVCGVMQLQDTQQLHGIPFKVTVAKTERNDKPGEFNNEIKGYMDMNGNGPDKAGAPAAGGSPASPFPAADATPAPTPAPAPAAPATPTPPAAMAKPTAAEHIHAAGTPEEKWWDGSAWQTPPVAAEPPKETAPATPPAPAAPATPEAPAAPAATDAAAPPPWAQ